MRNHHIKIHKKNIMPGVGGCVLRLVVCGVRRVGDVGGESKDIERNHPWGGLLWHVELSTQLIL